MTIRNIPTDLRYITISLN